VQAKKSVRCCLTGDLQNIDRAGGECERAGLQEFHTSQAGEKVSEPLSITTWVKKCVLQIRDHGKSKKISKVPTPKPEFC
jgi:hypothetical protein